MDLDLQTDNGFLRRACPRCGREFKWFSGDLESRPFDFVDPESYVCPYCGEASPADEFWTQAQLDYAAEVAASAAQEMMAGELKKLETRGGLFSIEVKVPDSGGTPIAPLEPSDMSAVEPPCHPFEPVKVPESWAGPLHCIVCGEKYVVSG